MPYSLTRTEASFPQTLNARCRSHEHQVAEPPLVVESRSTRERLDVPVSAEAAIPD